MAGNGNTEPNSDPTEYESDSDVDDFESLPSLGSHSVTNRLNKELMSLMMANVPGISAFPDGENIFKWVATIEGPPETVYATQKYRLSLEFPDNYPFAAPVVKFITKCYHPNVGAKGVICLDILNDKWSALYDVRTLLLSLQSLLGEPNNDSPLNSDAATLWSDQEKYKEHLDAYYEEHKDTTY